MKNFVFLFIAFLWMASCTQNKIAYVDMGSIMKDYDGLKAFDEEMEAEKDQLRKEIESLIEPYQLKVDEYYKKVDKMSAAEKSSAELALQQEQTAINEQQDKFMQQIEEQRLEGLEAINDEIADYVEEYAKSKGFQMVFGTLGTETVIYGEEKLNITQEVLIELNRLYSEK
jgi:outer membrane protein